jgi:hypothetical protein
VLVGVWVVVVVIALAVGAIVHLIAGSLDRRERRYELARSRGAARPVDHDLHEFTTLSAADWAVLYRRHRRRSVVRGILTLLAAPFAAIFLGLFILQSEQFFDARDLGWKWAQYLAAGIAVIAALATFFWGLRHAFVLMTTQLYVVIGQALERTSTQGDGLLVATEIEHSALRVNIDRCLNVDKRGHLSPSDRWSGIETFPGSSVA